MALGAAIGVGAGMAAAGAGVTAGALGVNGTGPRKNPYQYGGTDQATQQYRDQYAGQQMGAIGAQQVASQGLAQQQTVNQGNQAQIVGLGQSLAQNRAVGGTAGQQYLQGYDPGAVVQQQAANALQQQARGNLGAARGIGGAGAMRAALNANAEAGVQTALGSGAAMAQARNQQALAQQQAAAQAGVMGLQAAGINNQNAQAAAAMQGQALQFGQNYAADLYGQQQQFGMNREGMYLDATQQVEAQQLQAQIARDQARMQNQQQKRQILGGLGGALIGGGTSMIAGGLGK